MPDGDGWKETFKFFIKELEEVYLPQLKEIWDLVLPVPSLRGEPGEDVGEIPQPVPVPSPPAPPLPEILEMGEMQPAFPMSPVGAEPTWVPPYDPPAELPDRTPFPPWNPRLPYGYDAGTPTPFELDPWPMPWWRGPEGIEKPFVPWWRDMPPEIYSLDTHIVQAPSTDLERKA